MEVKNRERGASLDRYKYYTQRQLIKITMSDGKIGHFAYDALGRRISKTVDNVTTRYFWNGNEVLAELDISGNLMRSYAHGIEVDEVLYQDDYSKNETLYFHQDQLMSTVALTNQSDQVKESYSYDAYGNFATCGMPGAPLGFVHTNTFEGQELKQYLDRWSSTYRKEYTINVQQDSFYNAVKMYEQRNNGLAYNPAWQNSNYAAKSVVQNSGGQSQTIEHAPTSAFDWKAA